MLWSTDLYVGLLVEVGCCGFANTQSQSPKGLIASSKDAGFDKQKNLVNLKCYRVTVRTEDMTAIGLS